MKKCLGLVAILAMVAIPATANNVENAGDVANVNVTSTPGPIWAGPVGTVLVDNGPLINSTGTGVGGEDESILQGNLSMSTLGFGHQVSADNRVADDFTVGGEGWILDECTFFAYQTGSPLTSTMTGINLRIFDAAPPAGTVVFGDDSTNVLGSTGFTNILRVTDTTTGTTNNRPIMAQTVDMSGLNLAPGTYWFDWQTDGSLASGPWAPPITITGQTTTGDALQSTDGGTTYAALNDTGSATQQGLPFVCTGELIQGNPLEVPTLGQFGLIALLLSLAGLSVARLRRS